MEHDSAILALSGQQKLVTDLRTSRFKYKKLNKNEKMYTQLHVKFDGYCLKKSVINGLQLFCTNFASNGAPSENQANSKVQAKPTKVEKTDYVLLVLLIL